MSLNVVSRKTGRRHAEQVASFLVPIVAIIVFLMVMTAMALPYVMSNPSMGAMGPGSGRFRLIDGGGQIVTERSWPGKFLLVYFGYTHCPDICPTMLANIAGALTDLGTKADRIQPLFVTVDPQRDTPTVMKQYAALFSPRITGLTGTTAALTEAAQDYGVHYARQQTGVAPDDYEMAHSAYAYLVYPSGELALTIPPGQTSGQMASEFASQLR
jgi:protein SCO1/2